MKNLILALALLTLITGCTQKPLRGAIKYYGWQIVITESKQHSGHPWGFCVYNKGGVEEYRIDSKFETKIESLSYAEEYINDMEN